MPIFHIELVIMDLFAQVYAPGNLYSTVMFVCILWFVAETDETIDFMEICLLDPRIIKGHNNV